MADEKIIGRRNVKENNPNDDEEILKNTDADVKHNKDNRDAEEQPDENEKTQGIQTTGIP